MYRESSLAYVLVLRWIINVVFRLSEMTADTARSSLQPLLWGAALVQTTIPTRYRTRVITDNMASLQAFAEAGLRPNRNECRVTHKLHMAEKKLPRTGATEPEQTGGSHPPALAHRGTHTGDSKFASSELVQQGRRSGLTLRTATHENDCNLDEPTECLSAFDQTRCK